MPRQSRIDFPGAFHHVIIRGINKAAIFHDDRDRNKFLLRLGEGLNNTGLSCYAWTLIPNHVHLLLRTGPQPLTKLMSSLLTGYAVYFNKRHERVGYLFQNRYKSILCDEELYLLQLVRYIHLNPIRAGLVSELLELGSFSWSGHSVLIGNQKADWQNTGEILKRFGSTLRQARAGYLDFMRKGLNEGKRFDLTGGGLIRSAGGWQNLGELRKSGERLRGDERVLGDSDFVQRALKIAGENLTKKERHQKAGWSLEKLLDHLADMCDIDKSLIMGDSRNQSFSRARALFSWLATEELGFSVAETAAFLHKTPPAILYSIRKGSEIVKRGGIALPDIRA